MTLYMGIEAPDVKGTNQGVVEIKAEGLDGIKFAPISSSSQAVSRFLSMPAPGQNINTNQSTLSITPYHITKGHDWASRHIEGCIHNGGQSAIDIYIVNAVVVGTNAGLKPLFVKHLEGAYIAGLTREIDGDGNVTETISIIFQKCTHTYNEVDPKGKVTEIEKFDFDLNKGVSDSSPSGLKDSAYEVPE